MPKGQYKAPERQYKDIKCETKPKNIKQRPKIFHTSNNNYEFNITYLICNIKTTFMNQKCVTINKHVSMNP